MTRLTRLKKLAEERGDGLITVSFKDGSKQYLTGVECVELFMGEHFDTVTHFKGKWQKTRSASRSVEWHAGKLREEAGGIKRPPVFFL